MIPRNQYGKNLEEHLRLIPIDSLMLVDTEGRLFLNKKQVELEHYVTAATFHNNEIWYGCKNGNIYRYASKKRKTEPEKSGVRNRSIAGLFSSNGELYDLVEQNHRQVAVYLTKDSSYIDLLDIPENETCDFYARTLNSDGIALMKNTLLFFKRIWFDSEKSVDLPKPCKKLQAAKHYFYGIPKEGNGIMIINIWTHSINTVYDGTYLDCAICPEGWKI